MGTGVPKGSRNRMEVNPEHSIPHGVETIFQHNLLPWEGMNQQMKDKL
jgi:hypothetical protein